MAQWIGNKLMHDALGFLVEKKTPGRSSTLEMPEGTTAQNYTCTNHDCLIIVYRNGKVLSNNDAFPSCPACGVNGVVMEKKKKRKPKKVEDEPDPTAEFLARRHAVPDGPGACTCNNAEHNQYDEVCPLNAVPRQARDDECPVCGAGEGESCPDGIECSAGV